jgi:hypothetical protein
MDRNNEGCRGGSKKAEHKNKNVGGEGKVENGYWQMQKQRVIEAAGRR